MSEVNEFHISDKQIDFLKSEKNIVQNTESQQHIKTTEQEDTTTIPIKRSSFNSSPDIIEDLNKIIETKDEQTPKNVSNIIKRSSINKNQLETRKTEFFNVLTTRKPSVGEILENMESSKEIEDHHMYKDQSIQNSLVNPVEQENIEKNEQENEQEIEKEESQKERFLSFAIAPKNELIVESQSQELTFEENLQNINLFQKPILSEKNVKNIDESEKLKIEENIFSKTDKLLSFSVSEIIVNSSRGTNPEQLPKIKEDLGEKVKVEDDIYRSAIETSNPIVEEKRRNSDLSFENFHNIAQMAEKERMLSKKKKKKSPTGLAFLNISKIVNKEVAKNVNEKLINSQKEDLLIPTSDKIEIDGLDLKMNENGENVSEGLDKNGNVKNSLGLFEQVENGQKLGNEFIFEEKERSQSYVPGEIIEANSSFKQDSKRDFDKKDDFNDQGEVNVQKQESEKIIQKQESVKNVEVEPIIERRSEKNIDFLKQPSEKIIQKQESAKYVEVEPIIEKKSEKKVNIFESTSEKIIQKQESAKNVEFEPIIERRSEKEVNVQKQPSEKFIQKQESEKNIDFLKQPSEKFIQKQESEKNIDFFKQPSIKNVEVEPIIEKRSEKKVNIFESTSDKFIQKQESVKNVEVEQIFEKKSEKEGNIPKQESEKIIQKQESVKNIEFEPIIEKKSEKHLINPEIDDKIINHQENEIAISNKIQDELIINEKNSPIEQDHSNTNLINNNPQNPSEPMQKDNNIEIPTKIDSIKNLNSDFDKCFSQIIHLEQEETNGQKISFEDENKKNHTNIKLKKIVSDKQLIEENDNEEKSQNKIEQKHRILNSININFDENENENVSNRQESIKNKNSLGDLTNNLTEELKSQLFLENESELTQKVDNFNEKLSIPTNNNNNEMTNFEENMEEQKNEQSTKKISITKILDDKNQYSDTINLNLGETAKFIEEPMINLDNKPENTIIDNFENDNIEEIKKIDDKSDFDKIESLKNIQINNQTSIKSIEKPIETSNKEENEHINKPHSSLDSNNKPEEKVISFEQKSDIASSQSFLKNSFHMVESNAFQFNNDESEQLEPTQNAYIKKKEANVSQKKVETDDFNHNFDQTVSFGITSDDSPLIYSTNGPITMHNERLFVKSDLNENLNEDKSQFHQNLLTESPKNEIISKKKTNEDVFSSFQMFDQTNVDNPFDNSNQQQQEIMNNEHFDQQPVDPTIKTGDYDKDNNNFEKMKILTVLPSESNEVLDQNVNKKEMSIDNSQVISENEKSCLLEKNDQNEENRLNSVSTPFQNNERPILNTSSLEDSMAIEESQNDKKLENTPELEIFEEIRKKESNNKFFVKYVEIENNDLSQKSTSMTEQKRSLDVKIEENTRIEAYQLRPSERRILEESFKRKQSEPIEYNNVKNEENEPKAENIANETQILYAPIENDSFINTFEQKFSTEKPLISTYQSTQVRPSQSITYYQNEFKNNIIGQTKGTTGYNLKEPVLYNPIQYRSNQVDYKKVQSPLIPLNDIIKKTRACRFENQFDNLYNPDDQKPAFNKPIIADDIFKQSNLVSFSGPKKIVVNAPLNQFSNIQESIFNDRKSQTVDKKPYILETTYVKKNFEVKEKSPNVQIFKTSAHNFGENIKNYQSNIQKSSFFEDVKIPLFNEENIRNVNRPFVNSSNDKFIQKAEIRSNNDIKNETDKNIQKGFGQNESISPSRIFEMKINGNNNNDNIRFINHIESSNIDSTLKRVPVQTFRLNENTHSKEVKTLINEKSDFSSPKIKQIIRSGTPNYFRPDSRYQTNNSTVVFKNQSEAVSGYVAKNNIRSGHENALFSKVIHHQVLTPNDYQSRQYPVSNNYFSVQPQNQNFGVDVKTYRQGYPIEEVRRNVVFDGNKTQEMGNNANMRKDFEYSQN